MRGGGEAGWLRDWALPVGLVILESHAPLLDELEWGTAVQEAVAKAKARLREMVAAGRARESEERARAEG